VFSLVYVVTSCDDFVRVTKVNTGSVIIDSSLVKVEGEVVDVSELGIESIGHCWSLTPNPSFTDSTSDTDFGYTRRVFADEINYESILQGLSLNKTYNVRSFAQSGEQITYGPVTSFMVSAITQKIGIVSLDFLGEDKLTISVNVSRANSSSSLDVGTCWSLDSSSFVVDSNCVSFGSIRGDSTIQFFSTSLMLDTTYYLRAYIVPVVGETLYSEVSTKIISSLKVSTLHSYSDGSTITLLGKIDDLGVSEVVDYGHCWSESDSLPDLDDSVNSIGRANITGLYHTEISDQISGMIYYRSFARSVYGTVSFGELRILEP
jgi:hypothetical protein